MFGSDDGPTTHEDCPSPKDVTLLKKTVQLLIEVMTIQERRESGEYHLSAGAFKPVWDEAKTTAQQVLDDVG